MTTPSKDPHFAGDDVCIGDLRSEPVLTGIRHAPQVPIHHGITMHTWHSHLKQSSEVLRPSNAQIEIGNDVHGIYCATDDTLVCPVHVVYKSRVCGCLTAHHCVPQIYHLFASETNITMEWTKKTSTTNMRSGCLGWRIPTCDGSPKTTRLATPPKVRPRRSTASCF